MRFALLASVLSVGWLMPASAQMSDADAQRAGQSVLDAWNRTMIAKDVPGHAALYADNVIQVTPFGIIVGRPALAKAMEELVKTYTANLSTLEHVVMLGPNVMLRSGAWNGTLTLTNGSMPVRGYWSDVDVRDGDDWQIREESSSITPPPLPQQAQK
jgi:ketosteroid isomerase-like protein